MTLLGLAQEMQTNRLDRERKANKTLKILKVKLLLNYTKQLMSLVFYLF